MIPPDANDDVENDPGGNGPVRVDAAGTGAGATIPLRRRVARPALALGSGALVALSLPPWGFWPLALLGIALFDLTLRDTTSRPARARRGWLFGAGWMFLGMGWMVQLTGPGYIVAAAIFAGFHAFAAAIGTTLGRNGRWSVLARPVAHTLVEALRFSFPFGGVPLATLGMSQVGGPLVGVVRVGGVTLLTWLTFQLGFAIVPGVRGALRHMRETADGLPADDPVYRSTSERRAVTTALCLAVGTLAAAGFAPRGSDTGETLRIAVVQGGGEQGTRALDVPSIVVTERHLEATRTIAADPDLDLVLWPENTIDVENFEVSQEAAMIVAQADRLGVPIAVGLTEDVRVDGERRYTNAHVVVAPDGEIFSRYDKVRRVPFGEYVPLRSVIERFSSAVDQVGSPIAGTTPAVLDLP
ncbi:MAG: nitrilase-related carbon-nitrogen hydrolase, partial [Ilumatobacter sp.]